MWLSHSKFKEMLSRLYPPQRFLTSLPRRGYVKSPPLKYFTPWAPQWKADRQSCQMRGHRSKVWAARWWGGCEKQGREGGGGERSDGGDGFVCREDFTVCRVTESKDGTLSSLLPSWNLTVVQFFFFPACSEMSSHEWNGKESSDAPLRPKNLRAYCKPEFSR